ncbi:MAG: signal peptide peptidase SppA [Candidatus Sericytochromatia bacterium]|nr:signal peptide peptidase SppA [Candidatus Sericytochromatia bacterium]
MASTTERAWAVAVLVLAIGGAVGSWIRAPKRSLEAGGELTTGRPDVALLDLQGPITDSGPAGGLTGGTSGIGAQQTVKWLRQAEKDGARAILVRINSPGGTVAASQMIYEELMRIRTVAKIPVVAAFGDVAASGGYYIASAANHIVALPGSTTGSIGVILQVQEVSGLMGRLGIRDNTVKSGARKDVGSPFRPMDAGDRASLQALVDDSYAQFLEAIRRGRPKLTLNKLKPLADGRVFTGRQAKAVGLVDALGTPQEALSKAAALAGVVGEPTVRRYAKGSWLEGLLDLESHTLLGGGGVARQLGLTAGSWPAGIPLAVWP